MNNIVTIMMVSHSAFLLVLSLLPNANARLFTVVNLCPYTIWHVFSVLSGVRALLTIDG
jgi:hypothetical protein